RRVRDRPRHDGVDLDARIRRARTHARLVRALPGDVHADDRDALRLLTHASKVATGMLADRLAAWVCDLRYEDLPDDVVRKAKAHILFLVGAACVGGGSVIGTR